MLDIDSTSRPAAVVDAASVDEVRAAIASARDRGLRVAVQATGHGSSALGPLDRALSLRTAGLLGLSVDPAARIARVAAGHVWRDVAAAVDAHRLVAVAPAHPGVGVAGAILGGGIGWLARRHGLAATWVDAVELVASDGRLVRADRERERDLFWALRGGGGGLGVVTAVELRLLALDGLHAGALSWPATRAAEVLHAWARWIATAPDELTSMARLRRAGATTEVVVEAAFAGDAEAADGALAALRALDPDVDTFAAVSAVGLGALHDVPPPRLLRHCEHLLLDELPPEAIDALLEAAGAAAGFPFDDVELRHFGGALCRPSPDAGALASLDAEVAVTALAPPGADNAAEELLDALLPWRLGHCHGGFHTRPVPLCQMFTADAVRRLRAVKALHDPEDLFVGPSSDVPDHAG
ncbi:MAG TPA: FAD-dependent oxidoreductase [Capillimicrobium sp.]|nr:FAD-dependent oxidoreductase [Capillimicrobium sp.]